MTPFEYQSLVAILFQSNVEFSIILLRGKCKFKQIKNNLILCKKKRNETMCVSNDVFPLKAIYSSCGVILHERGNSKFKMADTRIVLNKIIFQTNI